jgi:hypothetical protein
MILRRGRSPSWKIANISPHCIHPIHESRSAPTTTQEGVATSQEALRKAVSRLRERYRDAVRDQIANTLRTPTDEEVESEMRSLRAVLS